MPGGPRLSQIDNGVAHCRYGLAATVDGV